MTARTSIRKPRKYLDKDRTQINPAWLEHREAEAYAVISSHGPGSLGMYFPEDEDREIPPNGCWIRVIEVPFTELDRRFEVPPLSMWWARPHTLNVGRIGGHSPKQAVIQTPGGDLHLWAHEYVLVPDISEWVGMEPNVVMHEMSGQPVFDTDGEERLFYLQSRGLTRRDAALLLVSDLTSAGFYFTMHEDVAAMFAGVGVPLWRHIQLHPRSAPFEDVS